jgi:hypothetical protein
MSNVSMREEIVAMAIIFVFCAFSIPVMIYFNEENKHDLEEINNMNLQDKMLRTAVGLIEDHNRNCQYNITIDTVFASLKGNESFLNLTAKDSDVFTKLPNENVDEIWSNFKFKNGSKLYSKNTLIPLKVDW